MGKKRILRLAEGMTLTTQVADNLKEILGEYKIEHYPAIPDLRRSYQRRIDSLNASFLFILDSIPEYKSKGEKLKNYLEWCRYFCPLPEGEKVSIKNYQDILVKYTSLLVNALVDYYPFEDKGKNRTKLAVELLNKAEQYVIMTKGRSDLATFIPIKLNESIDFVLRWEEQLIPYTELTFNEFAAIRESAISSENTMASVPTWFRNLSPLVQFYLHSCAPSELIQESDAQTLTSLKFNLNKFFIGWAEVKVKQGFLLENDLKAIAANKFPAWFGNFSLEHQQLLKLFCDSELNVTTITSALSHFDKCIQEWSSELGKPKAKNFSSKELIKLRKLPYWFLVLEDFEQEFVKFSLKNNKPLEDCISFAPSRLRRLPLLANFCQTNLFFLNAEGKIEKRPSARLRSSHLASRDITKLPIPVKKLHSERNMATISMHTSEDQPLLVQTLISPVPLLEAHIPDYYLDKQRQETVAHFQREHDQLIFSTNHPLNVAKYLYYTPTNDSSCLAILNLADIVLMTTHVSDIELADLKKIDGIIEDVFSRVEAEKESKTSIPVIQAQDSEENVVKKELRHLFSQNYSKLKETPGWKRIFARQLSLKTASNKLHEKNEYLKNMMDLQALSNEYREVLNSSYGSATILDFYGRELFLSSIENLLIGEANSKSYGSCVSGKDRKEVVETHTLAMQCYRERNGRWPSMHDTGQARAEFVEIVATLWVTWHGYELAGQNADGSDGVKTPYNYWPKDIADAICEKAGADELNNSDILATNNEVGRIGNLQVQDGFTDCLLSAMKLGKEARDKVINILAALCGESNFMKSKTYSLPLFQKVPTGVDGIEKILKGLGNDDNVSIYKLAQIYLEILQRPRARWVRATEIENLYEAILSLKKQPENEALVRENLEMLIKIKETAFQANRIIY